MSNERLGDATPIAVIGTAYRAPGIGRKGLWDYLSQARSAWTKIPADRFDHSAFANDKTGPDRSGVFRVDGAHFVPDDVFAFDAPFFNMRPDEAKTTDPQFRMALECALEAAEDAGYSLLEMSGQKIGVFMGAGQHEYANGLTDDQFSPGTFSATGVAPCMLANRISYFLNIDGPSIALDAACASSVYASHIAMASLRNGDCSAAFVGSSSLNLGPGGWLALGKTGALSQHGRSFSYDHKGTGFGRGEGGACLMIKRLDDAIRDGDPIQAVLRGSACNHGGRSEGITMPNGVAHRKLLRRAHESAGLDPRETAVIEGHGTGTGAGDPVEAGAFTSILAAERTAANPLYIGSLKSNFGHLEGASGVIAMVKAVKMLQHGIVLPTAGFEKINPRIEGNEKIRVPDTPVPWPAGEKKRILITNFGFGGSNSAIIIDGAPERAAVPAAVEGTKRLFAFSAKSDNSLKAYLSEFEEYLEDEAPESAEFVRDLSYTLGQRRSHFPYRAFAVSDSVEGLQEKVSAAKPNRIKDRVLAFVFTGQGAQYAEMSLGLRNHKVFAESLQEADKQLKELGAPWSLIDELSKPAAESRVNEAELSQPACTAVQVALISLLRSWGIAPTSVTGHSSGEIAAAYTAGLLTFRAAIAASYFRGQAAKRLTESQKKGAMVALGVGKDEALKLIEEHADGYATIAAINSPNSVTVSGDVPAVDNVFKAAEKQSLFARKLKVEMAYHSRHMEEVADWYLNEIKTYCEEKVEGGPKAAFVSSVFGELAEPSTVDATYWVKNLVQTVRFSDAVEGLFTPPANGHKGSIPNTIVEIGPHSALKGPIKQTVDGLVQKGSSPQAAASVYVASLIRGADANESLLDTAGNLFALGVPVELGAVNQTDKTNSYVASGLPAYSWDKSTSYKVNARPTHEKKFPGDSYHPLLGRPTLSNGGSNGGVEHVYRQVFTLDEMTWARDHAVGGATVFPMTGYLSCAIEACRRITNKPAESFLLRNVHIKQRLEIQEEQVIDIATKIKHAAIGTGVYSNSLWSWEISSWSEKTGWVIHAYGQIEAEFEEMSSNTPTLNTALGLVNTTPDLIENDVQKAMEYAGVRATNYGPAFRNTVRFFEAPRKAGRCEYTVLEHHLRDLGEVQTHLGSPVTVDPPTLDGFLQGGGPLQITEDGRRPAQMPNFLGRFRVSNKIPAEHKSRIDIVTRLIDYDIKGGRMTISVAAFARNADGSTTPVAEWESVGFRSIGSADEEIDPAAELPTHWAWEAMPRFDFLAQEALRKTLTVDFDLLNGPERARWTKLERCGAYYMTKALKETAGDDLSNVPFYLAKHLNWAKKVTKEWENNLADEALLKEVATIDGQGALLTLIGENLVRILRQEVEPLEIMLEEQRLTKYYEDDYANAELSKVIGDLLDNMGNLEPDLRILEIGGGTAGTTLPVLKGLSRGRDEPAFLNYTFTDISSGFFENARTKLAQWNDRITYKKLDITQDIIEQGFEDEEYDVIVASNVLHATEDMAVTMANCRRLLQPKGKLFLLEANRHSPMVLPFSLLPGWWYATDEYRDHAEGPMMPVSEWDRLLKDAGFSGVDVNVQAFHDETIGVMSSTRIGKQDDSHPVAVVGPFMDDEEVEFAQQVADAVSEHLGTPVETKPFAEVDPAEELNYIFIDSPRHSILTPDVSEETFEGLKNLTLHNRSLLWVLPEGVSIEGKGIRGIIRTLRLEALPKNLLMIEDVPTSSEGISAILKLSEGLRDPEVTRTQEQDFIYNNGSICLPRMRAMGLRELFAAEQGVQYKKTQGLWAGKRALEMTIEGAGSPDSIFYRRTDALQKPVADDEVVVEVEAAGLSYRDLDVILGQLPWTAPGYDGVGKVIKKGANVQDLNEGDAVVYLSLEGSGFATHKKLASWQVAKVPAGLSHTDAAGLPLAYTLAILTLKQVGRLRKGENVLIHSAAGAVGQAAITVAQKIGARVFVTAGSESKRNFLHETFGIPKEQIYSDRTGEFRDAVLVATAGKGVDVIVNSLGSELLTETWATAAHFGRFIDIGKKDSFLNNHLPMKSFYRNVTFSSVDLKDLFQYRPEDVKEVFTEVAELLSSKSLAPIQPVTVLPISEIDTGLRRLKNGDVTGKVVLTLGKDEKVVAESDLVSSQTQLKPDVTYVITGGTRGIGLDLAYWMADNGARNLVLLSRSGASSTGAQEILAKFQGTDVTVRAIACDIGSRDALVSALDSVKDLPPIKGVIHSALVLKDKIFDRATHDDWKAITEPRNNGARNLDSLLPQDLDFFIVLSSFLGDSGNAGQAIYAGTSTFYDAFCETRNAKGQYTVAIALPVVLDVGYVADNDLAETLKANLGGTLTMADIRTIMKGAVVGPSSPFYYRGKVAAFRIWLDGKPLSDDRMHYFHPVHTRERMKVESSRRGKASNGAVDAGNTSWTAAADPQAGLTEALITKVAAMTMMEREDVGSDTPLASFSLDSLVSVELRNWIRRETTVELTLSAITHAESLTSLAAEILAQRS